MKRKAFKISRWKGRFSVLRFAAHQSFLHGITLMAKGWWLKAKILEKRVEHRPVSGRKNSPKSSVGLKRYFISPGGVKEAAHYSRQ